MFNVGAIATPLIVPWLTTAYGWRTAFVATGAVAIIWLVAWWTLYRTPLERATTSAAGLAWVEQDPVDAARPLSWWAIVGRRETWSYALGRFRIDPIWWFFLFWLPGYLGGA